MVAIYRTAMGKFSMKGRRIFLWIVVAGLVLSGCNISVAGGTSGSSSTEASSNNAPPPCDIDLQQIGQMPAATSESGLAPKSCNDSDSSAPQVSEPTLTSDGGRVVVEMTWEGPSEGPVFRVILDSNSINLEDIDLRTMAVMRTDDGMLVKANGWDAPKDPRHRSGKLSFPVFTSEGTAVISPKTRIAEVVIRDLAGIPERAFKWTF